MVTIEGYAMKILISFIHLGFVRRLPHLEEWGGILLGICRA
jgi:hypothetical protein